MIATISFQSVIQATLQIFLLGLVGYVLLKEKIIDEPGLKLLSRLSVNLLLPCFIFDKLTSHFDYSLYLNWWIFPIICFSIILVGWALSVVFLLFCKESKVKNEFIASVIFQNCGYIPLLLVTSVFDEAIAHQMFVYIFLFIVGFDLLIWSLGVRLLARGKYRNFDFKNILTPPLITIFFSFIVISFGIHKMVPSAINKPVEMLGACALPLAMLIIGGNLALIKITDVRIKEMSLMMLVKLIILPSIALGFVLWAKIAPLIGFFIVLEAAVPSALTLSVIAQNYEGHQRFINQGILFGHLIGIVTVPLFLILYAHFSKGL